jgi:chaperonin cofactor prefoldin
MRRFSLTKSGKTKVAIVGFCETSRNLAPYEDDSYEIWQLNRAAIFSIRADRWFDLHSPQIRGTEERRPGDHLRFLQSFPGPVYLHEVDPTIPTSVAYPLRDVAEHLGSGLFRMSKNGETTESTRMPYMDSSIAYELALAIHEGFEEILLVGVDLNTESEYVFQRSGVHYWLGLAQGRGIKVTLPENCPLLTGSLYGRGYLNPEGEQISMDQLRSRFKAIREQRDQLVGQLNQIEGAHKELAGFVIPQMPPGVDRELVEKRVHKMQQQISQLTQQVMTLDGQLKETMYWIHITPEGQDPTDAIAQEESRQFGYSPSGGEQLSEGDESIWGTIEMHESPEPAGVAA